MCAMSVLDRVVQPPQAIDMSRATLSSMPREGLPVVAEARADGIGRLRGSISQRGAATAQRLIETGTVLSKLTAHGLIHLHLTGVAHGLPRSSSDTRSDLAGRTGRTREASGP